MDRPGQLVEFLVVQLLMVVNRTVDRDITCV